ncbi:MAG: hypothetical protein ACOX9A_13945 [Anaerolineae bacterium]|jgi:hypothetical protein
MQNTSSQPNQRLVYIQAGRIRENSPCSALDNRDPVLLARKGVLYFLSDPEVSPAILESICTSYYGDRCFDPIPCLKAALAAAYAEHPELCGQLPVAVVAQGLEISLVGTQEAAAWLIYHSGVRELLMPWKMAERYPCSDEPVPLYSTQWRLSTGDTVVISTQRAAHRLTDATMTRALRKGSFDSAAEALSRAVNRGHKEFHVPLSMIHVPGFRPMPSFTTPMQEAAMATQIPATTPAPRKPPRQGVSPIILALAVSLIAVATTLWIKRPAINLDNLSDMVIGYMLTPVASPTAEDSTAQAETPVPVPTEAPDEAAEEIVREEGDILPPPDLVSPEQDDTLYGSPLRLVWSWDGELAEDEYFDVRLWRLGQPQESVGLTKDTELEERPKGEGWHAWTVVVVRENGNGTDEEISDEPPAVSFRWSPTGAVGMLPPGNHSTDGS